MHNLKKAKIFYQDVQSKRGDFPNHVLNWQLIGKFSPGLKKILGERTIQTICDKRHQVTLDFLKSEFAAFLNNYEFSHSRQHNPKIIWTLWLQGYQSAPVIVQRTLDNMREFAENNGFQFRLLDETTLTQFIIFPEHILQKQAAGLMTSTAIADLLRVSLLATYGGTWIDSTVLIDKEFPVDYLERSFFSLKTGDMSDFSPNIAKNRWKTFLLSGNSALYTFTMDFFHEYYKKFDRQVDYLLIDYIFALAYEYSPTVRNEILSLEQTSPNLFWLERNFSREWTADEWREIKENTKIFKTTYKLPQTLSDDGRCYYSKLLNGKL